MNDEVPAWARLLREWRRAQSWTQREMAKQLADAAAHSGIRLPERDSLIRRIKDWETGRHRPRDPYPLLYARVFGVSEADIFSAPPISPVTDDGPEGITVTAPDIPWVWDPKPTADTLYHVTRSDLMLDRRHALQALTITAGLHLVDPAQRWLTRPTPQPPAGLAAGRVGVEEVAQLETAVRVFRAWDDSHGGGLARKAVIGQLNEVADLLRDGSYPSHLATRLWGVMAQLAKIAATMSWDCGMQTAAQKYYALALQVTRPAGDRPLGASILASMARQLLYFDQAHDALELVQLALDGVRDTATPRLRAMLHTRQAWAYARMGRPESFKRATALAEDAFSDAGPDDGDPDWIAYFDAAELAGVTGGRYLDLARHDARYADDALARISRAVELRRRSSGRSLALDQVGLAHVHLLRGDLDQAAAVGTAAAEAATRLHSDRVRKQLGELYSAVSARRDPVTAGLRDHIRATLAR